ncbi:MAG: radical SAM protein [Bacteroidales bacterium]|nr:radical SAM protein [Bacteroidales bacterium]
MCLYDSFNRKIDYLRISITDRCNYRCRYCINTQVVEFIPYEKILRYEEIIDFVKFVVPYGIEKIKITGGEPLVRKGIIDFIKKIALIRGIKDLSMTTNGFYLEEFAEKLYNAGLRRINVSLDTLDYDKYKEITLNGDLNKVLKGIEKAIKVGFNPIKINSVIDDKTTIYEIENLEKYCYNNGLQLRFIKRMDLKHGLFSKVINGEGGNCATCNRLRLTSDGYLMPCLFNDIRINIREHPYSYCLDFVLKNKPLKGTFNQVIKSFNSIGG